jgi:hypothetical protein
MPGRSAQATMMPARTLLFRCVLGLALVCALALRVIDTHLVGPASPHGIVSLEICGLKDGCAALLASWTPLTRSWALLSLGLDYLFLVAYPAAIGLGLAWLADRLPAAQARWTRRLAWSAPLMTLADASENTALVALLLLDGGPGAARMAALASCLKFGWIGVSLAGLVLACGAAWVHREDRKIRS